MFTNYFFNHSKYIEYLGREGHILKFGKVVIVIIVKTTFLDHNMQH